MKQAIDLLVECWYNVTPATINHAWRNILEGLPETRQVAVPGERQTVVAELTAAAEEARQIPGAGFAETSSEDIEEMIRPAPVTADEIMEEDAEAHDEDSTGEDEEGEDVSRGALPMTNIKKMIDLGAQLCHLLEQDPNINSEARCSFINKALAGYPEQYHAHINSFQQRQITSFLQRQNEKQPEAIPGPSREDDVTDFEGFNGDELDTFLDELEKRKGGHQ